MIISLDRSKNKSIEILVAWLKTLLETGMSPRVNATPIPVFEPKLIDIIVIKIW